MKIFTRTVIAVTLSALTMQAQGAEKATPSALRVVHSQVGDSSAGVPGKLRLYNIGKKQQYSSADKATFDTDIQSPKSVTYSLDGKTFYVNSLEGCKTAVYDSKTLEKKGVIEYRFSSGEGPLGAKPPGFYTFTHYKNGELRDFLGKPVESTWSHNGRYLWVPFYRRTFDINAQDPSAIAVIDARKNVIIKMFETGPLPKMVATSNDGNLIAVTHWGDNTVGFIDITGSDPDKWHHLEPLAAGAKLTLNFPMNSAVNRDSNSGLLLRGTVFTPDDRYLLVSGMAGPMSVFDIKAHRYVGSVPSVSNVRHLAIFDGNLYGSCNTAGTAIKMSLDSLVAGIDRAVASGSKSISFNGGIKRVNVGSGARTLEVSPDGKYLFVACNSGNAVYVVDAESMTVVDHIRNDSYPVGLALSPDGTQMIVTSQGRKGAGGGNAINIYKVVRPDLPNGVPVKQSVLADGGEEDLIEGNTPAAPVEDEGGIDSDTLMIIIISVIAGLLVFGCIMYFYPRKRRDSNGRRKREDIDGFIGED